MSFQIEDQLNLKPPTDKWKNFNANFRLFLLFRLKKTFKILGNQID